MNIYISGLSYGTTDADLTNLFAELEKFLQPKLFLIEKLVDPEDLLS